LPTPAHQSNEAVRAEILKFRENYVNTLNIEGPMSKSSHLEPVFLPTKDPMSLKLSLRDTESFNQEIFERFRKLKQTLNISPKISLSAKLLFISGNAKSNFEPVRGVAQTIGVISEFSEHAQQSTPAGHVPFKFDGGIGYLALPSDIDAKDIASKLSARIEKLQKTLAGIERNLANQDFVANAPAELVEETKGKANETKESIAKLDDFRKSLQ
jgi:valyl-tRNA synthetase